MISVVFFLVKQLGANTKIKGSSLPTFTSNHVAADPPALRHGCDIQKTPKTHFFPLKPM
jgi:hypothetical protein